MTIVETDSGKFELIKEVGIDSLKTSRVFLAEDGKDKKPVCLKIAERDFKREFKILDELVLELAKEREDPNHADLPHIPVPYGCGEVKFEGKKQHYLSREFISGTDMFVHFRDYVFTTAEERIVAVARAMQRSSLIVSFLHERGKYHRDLKPYDFVMEGHRVSLIDYETILKEGQHAPDRHPTFSAPEIVELDNTNSPGHLSDIYSLGKIAFSLIAVGIRPAYRQFIRGEEKDLGELNARFDLRIPDSLMAVLLKATSYSPSNRHDSAKELIQALKQSINP